MRTLISLGILLGTTVLTLGCGDDGASLFIRPFSSGGGALPLTELPLTIGQSHTLALTLSEKASSEVSVTVSNPYPALVEVTPSDVVTIPAGEDHKDVTFRGLGETTSAGVTITFSLGEGKHSRGLRVVVSDPTSGGS